MGCDLETTLAAVEVAAGASNPAEEERDGRRDLPPSRFPIAHGKTADPEAGPELDLGQSQIGPDPPKFIGAHHRARVLR